MAIESYLSKKDYLINFKEILRTTVLNGSSKNIRNEFCSYLL